MTENPRLVGLTYRDRMGRIRRRTVLPQTVWWGRGLDRHAERYDEEWQLNYLLTGSHTLRSVPIRDIIHWLGPGDDITRHSHYHRF